MENRLFKEIRKKTAVLVTFVLIGSIILNNLVTVKASGEKIFVDRIKVVDEEGASVSGGNVSVGDYDMVLTKNGDIRREDNNLIKEDTPDGPRYYIESDSKECKITSKGYEKLLVTLDNSEPENFVLNKIFAVDVSVSAGNSMTEDGNQEGISVAKAKLYIKKTGVEPGEEVTPVETNGDGRAVLHVTGSGSYKLWAEWEGMTLSETILEVGNAVSYPGVSDGDNEHPAAFHLLEESHLNFATCKITVQDHSVEGNPAEFKMYKMSSAENPDGNFVDRTGNYDVQTGSLVRLVVEPPEGTYLKEAFVTQGGQEREPIIPHTPQKDEGTVGGGTRSGEEAGPAAGSDTAVLDFIADSNAVVGVVFADKAQADQFVITIDDVAVRDEPFDVSAGNTQSYNLNLEKPGDYQVLEWSVSENDQKDQGNPEDAEKKGMITIDKAEDSIYCLNINEHAFQAGNGIYTIKCKVGYRWDADGEIADQQVVTAKVRAVAPKLEYGRDYYLEKDGKMLESWPDDGSYNSGISVVIPKDSALAAKGFTSYELVRFMKTSDEILSVSSGDIVAANSGEQITEPLKIDGRYRLKFIMKDKEEIYEDFEAETQDLLIDNTAPSDKIYILSSGDQDHFREDQTGGTDTRDQNTESKTYAQADKESEAGTKEGPTPKWYQYGSFAGSVYNQKELKLTVFVRDSDSNSDSDVVSGLEEIRIHYQTLKNTGNNQSLSDEVKTFKQQDEDIFFGKAEIDGQIYDSISLDFSVDENLQNYFRLTSVILTDKAGNVYATNSGDSGTEIREDKITYFLDRNAPELTVKLPEAKYAEEINKGTKDESMKDTVYYYDNPKEIVSMQIKEGHFFSNDVTQIIDKNSDIFKMSSSGFKEDGSCELTFPQNMDADGCYQFAFTYRDPSGNALIAASSGNVDQKLPAGSVLKDGIYTSPILVLDTKAPAINSIKWSDQADNDHKLALQGDMILTNKPFQLMVDFTEVNPESVTLQYINASGEEVNLKMEKIPQSQNNAETGDNSETGKNSSECTYGIHISEDKLGSTNNETVDQIVEIIIQDKAGHKIASNPIRIFFDHTPPELVGASSGIVKTPAGEWYREDKPDQEPLALEFKIEDYGKLSDVKLVALGDLGIEYEINLSSAAVRSSDQDSKKNIYTFKTPPEFFEKAPDQRLLYRLVMTDEFDNTSTDGSVDIGIDNTKPDHVAWISPDLAEDVKYYNEAGEPENLDALLTKTETVIPKTKDASKETADVQEKTEAARDQSEEIQENQEERSFYQYGAGSGTIYTNKNVTIHAFVRDAIGEKSIQDVNSGLQSAKVTYLYTEFSNYTQMNEKVHLNYGVKKVTKETEVFMTEVKIGDEYYNRCTIQLPIDDKQMLLGIESIVLTDAAGNEMTVSSGDSEKDQVSYVIDTESPLLKVELPAASDGKEEDGSTLYYNSNGQKISLTIRENHFFNSDVERTQRTESADRSVSMNDFIHQDGEKDNSNYNKAEFSLSEGEGIYQFALKYTDRSGNAMQGAPAVVTEDGVTVRPATSVDGNGTYISPVMIVDETAPKIDSFHWLDAEGERQEFRNLIALTDRELTLELEFTEKYVASVELLDKDGKIIGSLEDQSKTDSPEGQDILRDKVKHVYTYRITEDIFARQGETTNKVLYVRIKDKAGNTTITDCVRVIIDKDGPELISGIGKLPGDEWYSRDVKNGQPMQFTFTIRDYAALNSVKLEAPGRPETAHVIPLAGPVAGPDEATGYWTYEFTTPVELFGADPDQKLDYELVLEDQFGNRTNSSSDDSEKGSINVGIDNTLPSRQVYVNFRGDKDKFYNSSGLLAGAVNSYEYGSQTGTLYNKDEVTLSVFVQDHAAQDAVDAAASGLTRVRVVYSFTDSTNRTQKNQTAVLNFSEGQENAVISRYKANINGRLYDEVVFRLEVKDGQKIAGITSVELTDAAGNHNSASCSGITMDQVDYVIDNTAPVLTAQIPAGSSGYDKDSNTYYYDTPVDSIAVAIAENNFFVEDVKPVLKTGEAGRETSMGGFTFSGGNEYRSSFALQDGDGIYRFSLAYTDRSENAMVRKEDGREDVANGLYTSPVLVVDTVAPVLDIRYYLGGTDVTDHIYAGNCFSGDITAVISVQEVNFDPELVSISFGAESAGDNGGFGHTYDPSGWSQAGDTYTYTIGCTEEAVYHISAQCQDKAGHMSNQAQASSFTVDKTAPGVAITYDTTIESTYYKTDRTATITVVDQNFNPDSTNYVITTTGPQPAISSWSHASGNGCGGSNHVKGCTWSCQVGFTQDADYTLGFNCSDRAGNYAASAEGQKFTVDKTNPVIAVSYDNNSAQNDNYFKEARQATITITEHNFDEAAAVVTVETPDGSVNSHTGWRNTGEDTYVSTIRYDEDGDYSFHISFVDQAGNEAAQYPGDYFVIDKTPPVLELKGVKPHSANKGLVAPAVSYTDKNYDSAAVSIRITGVNNGEIRLEEERSTRADGQDIQFMDFSHVREMDDMYTLTASVTDKAGNVTEDNLLFSVNRFGSVYVLGEDTKEALEKFYVNYGPELTVTEINVDSLEFREIAYSLDGNIVTLEQDKDYTVEESGAEYEWKQYIYHIPGENFEQEGLYAVTIQSEDRAENSTNNRLKEKEIEFVVDRTNPTIVVGGIEDNARYKEESRTVTIDAADNIYLTSVEVYVNDGLAARFDEEALEAGGGILTVDVAGAQKWQTMYVKAVDAAGNETISTPVRFLITANLLVQWINNQALFAGSIAGVGVLGGGAFTGFRLRRKKKLVKS